MSLSLHVSQTRGDGGATASHIDISATPTPSNEQQTSQSHSQRASAATRARRAAAAAAAANGSSIAAAPAAAAAASSLEHDTPSAKDAVPTNGGDITSRAGRTTRGRVSATASQQILVSPSPPPPTHTYGSSSIAAAAAAATPPLASAAPASAHSSMTPPVSSRSSRISSSWAYVDDGSSSFLSPFTFAPSDGPPREPGGTFLAWVHYVPPRKRGGGGADDDSDDDGVDSLELVLVQQSSLHRIYSFRGPLSSLRPAGLYMAGMKTNDYRAYVLNGLSAQDTRDNYEYELITNDEESDDPSSLDTADDGTRIVRAQLKLYKQLGETTRVPVCIANVPFEAVRLAASSDPHVAVERARQDPLEYQTATSRLLTSLCDWTRRLKARRVAHDGVLARQAAELKVAEDLSTVPPPHGDVPLSSRALLQQMTHVLNARKATIRARREENAAIEAECAAMRPRVRRGRAGAGAGAAASSEESSSSDDDVVSDSDDEVVAAHMPLAAAAPALADDTGVQPMELDEPSPPLAAAGIDPSVGVGESISFPDSIDPASLGSFSATFALSSPPRGATSQTTPTQHAPSPASLGNYTAAALSPPKSRAIVRKRSGQTRTSPHILKPQHTQAARAWTIALTPIPPLRVCCVPQCSSYGGSTLSLTAVIRLLPALLVFLSRAFAPPVCFCRSSGSKLVSRRCRRCSRRRCGASESRCIAGDARARVARGCIAQAGRTCQRCKSTRLHVWQEEDAGLAVSTARHSARTSRGGE